MRRPDDQIQKDPSSVEPQGFDWTAYLLELGSSVQIATSVWSFTGADAVLVLDDDIIVSGNLKTQVMISAGTLGRRYTVTNRITTNSTPPVIDDRSFVVLVQER